MQKIPINFQNAETQFKRLKIDFNRIRTELYGKTTVTCEFCFKPIQTGTSNKHYVCAECVRFIRGLQAINKQQINWYCAICYQSTKGLTPSELYGTVKSFRDIGVIHQYNHLQCVKNQLPALNTYTLTIESQLKLL